MEKNSVKRRLGDFSGRREREVEPVVSLEPPSRRRRSSIEQMRDNVGVSAAPVLSNRYKLLKTFKKGSCHLYFTNRILMCTAPSARRQTDRSIRCAS